MQKPKIIFVGCSNFSRDILQALLEFSFEVSHVFTSPSTFKISYSKTPVQNINYADLSQICTQHNIDFTIIDTEAGQKLSHFEQKILESNPDIILTMGWYHKIPKTIYSKAAHGAWAIHASLLPNYAGGAPLVWALIEGQTKTGVTLFRLDESTDGGDIIRQKDISLENTDTIATAYKKATEASIEILLDALKNYTKIEYKPQDKSKLKYYPQRCPSDGKIDLSWPGKRIYDFIRAQSTPYPGAYIETVDGKKIIIESARIED